MIDEAFLAILACPVCESRPAFELQGDYLICTEKRHGFPIIDGIPHLLPENVIEPEKLQEMLNAR